MENVPPSVEDWKNLYDAAIQFKKIETWKWMNDSDLFGVKNPANGEIGYCCVVGALGEVLGLVVWLGTEGLDVHLKIQAGEILPQDPDALYLHRCLMAEFEDREALEKRDLETIGHLGLKFRGHNAWPLFRSYEPGYFPWYLTSDEARFLTLALTQATDVCLRFKTNPGMLTSVKDDCCFVRVPETGNEGLSWHDQWLAPRVLKEKEIEPGPIDEVRLERIRQRSSHQGGTWEIDFFHFPTAVRDKDEEKPFYPHVFLWVDHDSSFVLKTYLERPETAMSQFMTQALDLFGEWETLPEKVLVKKQEIFDLLDLIASPLGIRLKLVKRLTAMEQVRASMSTHLIPRGLG